MKKILLLISLLTISLLSYSQELKAVQFYNSVVCSWTNITKDCIYIVEGSEDGKTFKELSRVESDNSSNNSYQVGVAYYPYYRLVQVNMDNSKVVYFVKTGYFEVQKSFKGFDYKAL